MIFQTRSIPYSNVNINEVRTKSCIEIRVDVDLKWSVKTNFTFYGFVYELLSLLYLSHGQSLIMINVKILLNCKKNGPKGFWM